MLNLRKTILSVKEYNVKRHYKTDHKLKFDSLIGNLRQIKINSLKCSLNNQQNSFKLHHQNELGICASFVVAEIIAKCNRPFNDSEFIKKCMLSVLEEICPDKKKDYLKTSVSQLGPALDVPKS